MLIPSSWIIFQSLFKDKNPFEVLLYVSIAFFSSLIFFFAIFF